MKIKAPPRFFYLKSVYLARYQKALNTEVLQNVQYTIQRYAKSTSLGLFTIETDCRNSVNFIFAAGKQTNSRTAR